MDFQHYKQSLIDMSQKAIDVLLMTETYAQLGLVLAIFGFAYVVANRIRHYIPVLATPQPDVQLKLLQRFFSKLGNLIFPLLTILILSIVAEISAKTLGQSWLLQSALIVAMLLVFNALIRDHVKLDFLKFVFRWVGLPLLFLHLVGLLAPLIEILESLSVTIGNIEVSMYGVLRVTLFGSLLFWLGRVSNSTDARKNWISAPGKWQPSYSKSPFS